MEKSAEMTWEMHHRYVILHTVYLPSRGLKWISAWDGGVDRGHGGGGDGGGGGCEGSGGDDCDVMLKV